MISDWSGEFINPVFEVEDRYFDDFEKFAFRASPSADPTVEKLKDEAAVLRFVNEVS